MKFLRQSLVAASVVAVSANFISRIFGYAREVVIANYFGTGSSLDIFLIAFTFPELIFTVAYSSIPTALIPALKKIRLKTELNDSSLFLSGSIIFASLFGILAVLSFILRRTIIGLIAPDFTGPQIETATHLFSIVTFCVFFMGMEVYFRSWQFEKKHFIIPTSSGIVLNLVILAALLTLYQGRGINSLAFGWLFGSIALFTYNGISATKLVGIRGSFSLDFSWAGLLIKSVVFIIVIEMIPFLYVPLDRFLAANYLATGSISGLKFALVLFQLPVGMFIVAFNIAAFPWISDYSTDENKKTLLDLYNNGALLITFVIGFTSLGIILFSTDLVSLAYQRGAFDSLSLKLTSGPLRYYAMGALFYSIYIFQMRFYYASRSLARLGVILFSSFVIKIVLSLVLIGPMKHDGLALATTLSWFCGFIIITIDLNKSAGLFPRQLFSASSLKILLNIALVAAVWLLLKAIWPLELSRPFAANLFRFTVLGLIGLGVYLGLTVMMRLPEPLKVYNTIIGKIRNSRESGK